MFSGLLGVHDRQVSMQHGEPKEIKLGMCWSRSRSSKSVVDENFKNSPEELDVSHSSLANRRPN
jgi:hypothetical protein